MITDILYILTEDFNFSFRLKTKLDEKKISFRLLDFDYKIPSLVSIILTTLEEEPKIKKTNEKQILLPYSREDDFEEYFIRVLATLRVGFKPYYEKLIFSIDPGKKYGLIIFLDDFYLDSFCCFDKKEILRKIKLYLRAFQAKNPKLLKLHFKLGRGVLSLAHDLVTEIYKLIPKNHETIIELIDEYKSSQIKINNNDLWFKFTKDEISAIIIALREGIEVSRDDFEKVFIRLKKNKLERNRMKILDHQKIRENLLNIADVVKLILKGKFSLKQATEYISYWNENNFILKN